MTRLFPTHPRQLAAAESQLVARQIQGLRQRAGELQGEEVLDAAQRGERNPQEGKHHHQHHHQAEQRVEGALETRGAQPPCPAARRCRHFSHLLFARIARDQDVERQQRDHAGEKDRDPDRRGPADVQASEHLVVLQHGQRHGQTGRTAAREQEGQVEEGEVVGPREHRGESDGRLEMGQDDILELCQLPGSVHLGRFQLLFRQRLQGREHDDEHQRQALPGVRQHHRRQGEVGIPEEAQRLAEDPELQAELVEDPVVRIAQP